MVDVAQSVRVTDCGSEGRGFESHLPPLLKRKAFGYAERFFSCGIFADRGSPTAAGQNELCELQSAARGGGELRGSLNRNNSRVRVLGPELLHPRLYISMYRIRSAATYVPSEEGIAKQSSASAVAARQSAQARLLSPAERILGEGQTCKHGLWPRVDDRWSCFTTI